MRSADETNGLPPVGEIAARLAARTEEFCRRHLPGGTRQGGVWRCADVRGGKGESLVVTLHGPRAGKFRDYATGEYGDLIDILRLGRGLRNGEAVGLAREWLGDRTTQPLAVPTAEVPQRNLASEVDPRSAALFGRGRPIPGTPAEDYLRSRGLSVSEGSLRYFANTFYKADAALEARPALLASISTEDATIIGVNRTYLDEQGTIASVATPKRVLGRVMGGAVRFGITGSELIVGEGIETVLSARVALPETSCAALLSAVHLSRFTPSPNVRTLWIVADPDPAGEGAARTLISRLRELRPRTRCIVLRPRGSGDLNDRLQELGVDALRKRLLQVMDRLRGGST